MRATLLPPTRFRVLAFEPVPLFHAFLEYSVFLNGLAHLVVSGEDDREHS